jgi:glycosyltransferase involved in cell wall biosynthesis
MKKRILIVSPSIAGLGGISKVLAIWRDADFFAGHDVTYIPTTNDATSSKLLTALLAVCQFLIKLPVADVVYIHCAAYTSFFRKSVFILLAALFGKQTILHIHPNEFYDFISRLSRYPRAYSFYVLGKVDTFVVLTEELHDRISRLFPGKPVHVVRNAVNLQEMADASGVQRSDADLIYLGWYIREKGVYELVDAIGLLKGRGIAVHLNFFGTKEIEQLTGYVRKKNLTDVITVNGWIGGEEKLRALYRSSMLILPSHSEGIPNVILEAMATRTPIVATFVGGIKEVLRDGENALIVDVGNAVDLSEKIARMLEDKELRSRLAATAYREAADKYDVPVIRTVFRSIIAEAGRR